MKADEKLERLMKEIIKNKKTKDGNTLELEDYEWKHVREIGRDVRDGRITQSKKMVEKLKNREVLRKSLDDKDFGYLVREMEREDYFEQSE